MSGWRGGEGRGRRDGGWEKEDVSSRSLSAADLAVLWPFHDPELETRVEVLSASSDERSDHLRDVLRGELSLLPLPSSPPSAMSSPPPEG